MRWEKRDEQSKLAILAFLSEPPDSGFFGRASNGATASEISLKLRGKAVNAGRVLVDMQVAGLVTREGPSKPYLITDDGRRHLEEARQKAMLLSPIERMGWADEVGGETHSQISGYLRRLPEFKGDEARVQEVSRGLAEAIGLPAPKTGRRDAEGLGR